MAGAMIRRHPVRSRPGTRSWPIGNGQCPGGSTWLPLLPLWLGPGDSSRCIRDAHLVGPGRSAAKIDQPGAASVSWRLFPTVATLPVVSPWSLPCIGASALVRASAATSPGPGGNGRCTDPPATGPIWSGGSVTSSLAMADALVIMLRGTLTSVTISLPKSWS